MSTSLRLTYWNHHLEKEDTYNLPSLVTSAVAANPWGEFVMNNFRKLPNKHVFSNSLFVVLAKHFMHALEIGSYHVCLREEKKRSMIWHWIEQIWNTSDQTRRCSYQAFEQIFIQKLRAENMSDEDW